jgi:outer membrane protein OmpA-like peptidoglycan-associated protein
MMLSRTASPWWSAATILFLACAHQPPKELAGAQMAYYKASSGQAASVVPDELHKAQLALASAEKAANDDPQAQTTQDLIYVAERRAELAEAKARYELSRQKKADADASYTEGLEHKAKVSESELAREKQQRSVTEAQLAQQRAQTEAASDRAAQEAQARSEAEQKAEAATQDLARIAQLREEERGLVIALPGDLLFATDEATLLPSAQLKLNQVADALRDQPERLVIEGHTDSRGSDSYNLDLSRRRAEAVVVYLQSRGIAADRMQAMAFGKSRPIADNRSAEGRANNRRVEIILQGKHTARK